MHAVFVEDLARFMSADVLTSLKATAIAAEMCSMSATCVAAKASLMALVIAMET